ncbi:MAG TPA: FAD-dependent oxidoreductase, partial [Vicinamibacteria bacterium]|nr:FAD-dependent oxidoreductase [Vicinamibacteria bacterium]
MPPAASPPATGRSPRAARSAPARVSTRSTPAGKGGSSIAATRAATTTAEPAILRLMTPRVTIVGGGLAGCEAAWQLARRGVGVDLYEMRPSVRTPVHQTAELAELVCSNSLRGNALDQAAGLLKE